MIHNRKTLQFDPRINPTAEDKDYLLALKTKSEEIAKEILQCEAEKNGFYIEHKTLGRYKNPLHGLKKNNSQTSKNELGLYFSTDHSHTEACQQIREELNSDKQVYKETPCEITQVYLKLHNPKVLTETNHEELCLWEGIHTQGDHGHHDGYLLFFGEKQFDARILHHSQARNAQIVLRNSNGTIIPPSIRFKSLPENEKCS